MRAARIYRSYEDFERDELRQNDRFQVTIDEMLDDMFAEELDFEPGAAKARSRSKVDAADVDDDTF